MLVFIVYLLGCFVSLVAFFAYLTCFDMKCRANDLMAMVICFLFSWFGALILIASIITEVNWSFESILSWMDDTTDLLRKFIQGRK